MAKWLQDSNVLFNWLIMGYIRWATKQLKQIKLKSSQGSTDHCPAPTPTHTHPLPPPPPPLPPSLKVATGFECFIQLAHYALYKMSNKTTKANKTKIVSRIDRSLPRSLPYPMRSPHSPFHPRNYAINIVDVYCIIRSNSVHAHQTETPTSLGLPVF